jgi:hypothetical protein
MILMKKNFIKWVCLLSLLVICGCGSDDKNTLSPFAGTGGVSFITAAGSGEAKSTSITGSGGLKTTVGNGGSTQSGSNAGKQTIGTGGNKASANAGTGGASAGSATGAGRAGTGEATAGGGGAKQTGDGCTIGKWAAADPTASAGPFVTITEENVGPAAGAAENGIQPKFTMFRPKDLAQGGLCHPVITWGNGTGSTPAVYKPLLNLFASHGFVVIASNSKNVAQGDPKPMVVGVTWVLEQNEDPSSGLYHRIDPTHVGATGHSQGAMATSQAAGDSHITTNVPIEGAMTQQNLHGPSMLFCGGQDNIVGCNGAQQAFTAITTLPAMYAEYLSVDHGSWMSRTGTPSAVDAAITAWFRLHLMGDDSLRSWFYGASCKLCTDSGWKIQQKNMDQ